MNQDLEIVAALYEKIAEELTIASQHCQTAAKRMQDGHVPRGCAHGFAAYGNIQRALRALDKIADIHSSKASVE